MKLQPNLYENIMPFGKNRWRIFMEWFESGTDHNDYRWSPSFRTGDYASDSTSAHFRLANEVQLTPTGSFAVDTVLNKLGMVPVDEWFKVEVYWKQANDNTGRIWIGVNGNTFVDFHGRNTNQTSPSPIDNWQIFKLYHSKQSMDAGDVYQWIDDVEIWDSIPDQVTGLDEKIDKKRIQVKLFPNPVSDNITILWRNEKFLARQLRLLNANGKSIMIEADLENRSSYTFSVANLTPGIYFIELSDVRDRVVKKVIIK